jgi:hypothetical protein
MSIVLTPFSLFGAFGNNVFSLAVVSVGGNPGYGQPHPIQGTIPTEGAHLGIPSSQGPWNPWQGPVPLPGMSIEATPSIPNGTPGKAQCLCSSDRQGETLPKSLEYDASPSLYILLQEPVDDVSTSIEFVCWSGPWLLPVPWLAT